MGSDENYPTVVLPAHVATKLRALIAEYDPETFSDGVVLTILLEELGSHLGISIKEEAENEETQS